GRQVQVSHFRPPKRGVLKPNQVAAQASKVTIMDNTRPPGMLAQASRAWVRALRKPTTQVITKIAVYTIRPPARRWARHRSITAKSRAMLVSTMAPTISHEAKLFHW